MADFSEDLPVDPAIDPEASLGPGEEIVPLSEVDTFPAPIPPQEAFPIAYDEEGNLLPGYELTENNDPIYVGPGTTATIYAPGQVQPSGVAYDDEGNLLPGYQLNENNDPVYVGAGTTATVYGPTPVQPSGVAYDDEGNLLPGYALDPSGKPVFIGGGYVAPATQAQADADRASALRDRARQQQTISSQRKQVNKSDWRVRLRLAPQSKYLYNAPAPGILQPLTVTDGVIFPYTPAITTSYKANYSSYDLTHSNYRGYFYTNSLVENLNLTATFTAQDTNEANYLLAVIHFFRSVTKMFYGQDAERGTPPPMVFLTGLGEYQFNEHPCLVNSFSYNLPADVNYIRAGSVTNTGTNLTVRRDRQSVATNGVFGSLNRLAAAFLTKGAIPNTPPPATFGSNNPTYVPTKIEIQLALLPVQSRQQVSKQFSLKEFANGNLLKGGFW
jgi:hypothetical protein